MPMASFYLAAVLVGVFVPPTPSFATDVYEVPLSGPLTGPDAYVMKECMIGYKLATQDAVAANILTGDWNITMIPVDAGCDAARGLLSILIDINIITNDKIVALNGAWCSSSSQTESFVTSQFHIPQITYGSESAIFSDKKQHPYFVRNAANVKLEAEFRAAVMTEFAWDCVVTLQVSDDYSDSAQTALASELLKRNINQVAHFTFQWDQQDLTSLMGDLTKTGVRIFVVTVTNYDLCNRVMTYAEKAGLTGAGYVWLPISWCIVGNTNTSVLNTLSGSIYMDWDVTNHPTGKAYLDRYALEDPVPPSTSGVLAYDNWNLLYKSISKVRLAGGDPYDGPTLLAALTTTEFQGATGWISFDASFDREGFLAKAQNILFPGTSQALIGTVDFSKTGIVVTLNKDKIVWPDKSNTPMKKCRASSTGSASVAIATGVGVGGTSLLSIALGIVLVVVWFQRKRHAEMLLASAPRGLVAVVFTDIMGSTLIWDCNPDVMSVALDIHNRLIRERIKRHRGYEVKTIGDAFMLVFPDICEAVRFSTGIQSDLLLADWSEELLEHPMAKTEITATGEVLFRGLRVRVGVHAGEPTPLIITETNKVDYFGPTVNETSRVESKAVGGQVVISREVYDVLVHHEADTEFIISPLGFVHLKGVTTARELWSVSNPKLSERKFVLVEDVSCPACGTHMNCPKCDSLGKAKVPKHLRRKKHNLQRVGSYKSIAVSQAPSVTQSGDSRPGTAGSTTKKAPSKGDLLVDDLTHHTIAIMGGSMVGSSPNNSPKNKPLSPLW